MRSAILVATLSLILVGHARAQAPVVNSFHGYPWGTPVAAIPEIAESAQVGVKEGLPIYSSVVELRGRTVLAGFYFHPDTGGLVEGAYVYTFTLQECLGVWADVMERLEATFPGLEKDAQIPTRASDPRGHVYDTDCEYYAFNAHREVWEVIYSNPVPPGDRVWLWASTNERSPRLTVLYRGGPGMAWAESGDPRRGGPG